MNILFVTVHKFLKLIPIYDSSHEMQNIFNRTDSRTACNEIEGVGGINQYVISGTCKGAKKCFNPLLESINGILLDYVVKVMQIALFLYRHKSIN